MGRGRFAHHCRKRARSAALLRAHGISRVVLVTHAADVARARAEFADAGITMIPAPTLVPAPHVPDWRDWLPGIGGLEASHHALYELLALAVRSVTPREILQSGGGLR